MGRGQLAIPSPTTITMPCHVIAAQSNQQRHLTRLPCCPSPTSTPSPVLPPVTPMASPLISPFPHLSPTRHPSTESSTRNNAPLFPG